MQSRRREIHKIKKRKATLNDHIFPTNCLLKYVVEGKIEGRIAVTGRRRRRHKLLLDDLKEKRGYCRLKEGALGCIELTWKRLWTCRKQTTAWMNTISYHV
jgi:hypothetical protein